MRKKDITPTEILTVAIIAAVLGLIFIPTIINHANKINHGEIVSKSYTAAYSTYDGESLDHWYHPQRCELTIRGEKNGKTVEYTFCVPEAEYVMYEIGDWYPKEEQQ